MHRVRGASGDVLARGAGFPQISAPRAPLAPCFHPPKTVHPPSFLASDNACLLLMEAQR